MLNCELCDYYKAVNSKNKNVCMCEFTGFVFHKEPEEYEMNSHPCYAYDANNVSEKVKNINLVSERESITA